MSVDVSPVNYSDSESDFFPGPLLLSLVSPSVETTMSFMRVADLPSKGTSLNLL